MNNERTVVEILWTGGYDSSFRIVQLSRLDIDIQPYYLSDNRKSEQNELKAILDITDALQKHPQTKCIFRPLIIVSMSQRIEDEKITQTYNRLLQTDFFGSQYDWLARFSKIHKGIELSIHQDDKAIILINKYGKLKRVFDSTLGEYYILDKENSSEDICTLFENYHFPLAHYTKLDMRKQYNAQNYTAIMKKTWFCFNPIDGKPCGTCNPCKYTIEEGMWRRFTPHALLRYTKRKIKDIVKG